MKPIRILVLLLLSLTVAVTAGAQTCRTDIAATTPTSLFIINADATVTDSVTGLVWKRCSEGQSWDGTTCNGSATTFSSWQPALQAASDAVFAGADDWRLPNKNELASLVERQCISPAINETVFPATPSWFFWSSSSSSEIPKFAWSVNFDSGDVGTFDKSLDFHVRLVRGGE